MFDTSQVRSFWSNIFDFIFKLFGLHHVQYVLNRAFMIARRTMGCWNVREWRFLHFSMCTFHLAFILRMATFFFIPLLARGYSKTNFIIYIFIMSHRTSPINFYLNYKFYNVRNFHIHAINHWKKKNIYKIERDIACVSCECVCMLRSHFIIFQYFTFLNRNTLYDAVRRVWYFAWTVFAAKK